MTCRPSEMVGAKRTGIRGIEGRELRTIGTSHVERLNGTQRVFMERLNRLTLCFSKKLENLEAAFGCSRRTTTIAGKLDTPTRAARLAPSDRAPL